MDIKTLPNWKCGLTNISIVGIGKYYIITNLVNYDWCITQAIQYNWLVEKGM